MTNFLRFGYSYCWPIMVFVAACCQLLAQAPPGASGIAGTLSDQSGAVVTGATVTAIGGAGPSRTTTTDTQGEYTIQGLMPGAYTVSITAAGFKAFRSASVTVTTGQITRIDASLTLAAEESSVNVQAAGAAQLESDTAQISGTITQQEVVKYGLNGRNFTQLIALAPGVSNQTGQDEAKVGVVGSVKYSVNGGRVEYNTFEVDGSDLLNAGINGADSTLIVYPSVDALQEIRVLTSNYGAMYGRTASGAVLVATKSGTEQFHGNGYYFGRNEFFNARNFFDETKGAPLYRRHDLGATLGGPLYIPNVYNNKKDKTFFFFSEEYRLEKSPSQYNQSVPSVGERAGDFSDVCPPGGGLFSRTKYPDCPSTTSSPFKGLLYQAFPNNKLTSQAAIDRNAAAILASGIIPAPNATSGCNSTTGSCYAITVSPTTHWREDLLRVDHNLNTNTRATLRYIHDAWDTVLPTPQWGIIQNSFPTVENRFVGPGVSLVTHLTQTLSPTLVNDVMFTFGNSTLTLTDQSGPGADLQRPAALNAPCANPNPNRPNETQCPMGYLFSNGFGGKMPGIVIEGPNAAYGGNGFAVDSSYMPWKHTNPVYTFGDNLGKALGKHNVQVGGQWSVYLRDQTNGPIGSATGDVQGIVTFGSLSNPNSHGNGFADFLFNTGGPDAGGAVKSFTQDSAQRQYSQRYQLAEPYLQDDWRVTPRLTVNLGLRVSLFGTYREKNHTAYNWVKTAYDPALAGAVYVDPYFGSLNDNSSGGNTGPPIPLDLANLDLRITNGLVRCGTNGVPSGCMKGHLFNPAPRIGFAWDPTGSGKMSLRGGYGIFFEHGTGVEANTGSLEASSPLVLNMTQNHPHGWPCIGGANPDVCGISVPPAFPLNVTSIPTKAVWPYVQQWSVSLQRELSTNSVATVAYVGSKGTHLTDQRQLNQLPPLPDSENPFGQHEPIIPLVPGPGVAPFGDCGGFFGPYFQLKNGTIVNQGDPAYLNLEVACFGVLQISQGAGRFPEPNALRQYAPGIGRIIALENSANSIYNAIQATFRRVQGPLTLGVAYTYSHSFDNSSDRSDNTFVNSFDLRSNWAKSNFDQRHLLTVSYIYELPVLPILSSLSDEPITHPSAFLKRVSEGWSLSGITIYQSGTPFSVVNSAGTNVSVLDNAGVANGAGTGSYPDLVDDPNGPLPAGGQNGRSFGPLLLNPGAFAAPRGLTFGDAGRNVLNNPRRWNFDLSVLRNLKLGESKNVELRFEVFNVLNKTQFRIYDPNHGNQANNTISCYGGPASAYSAAGGGGVNCLTGSGFLHPVDAHRPRTIQFGVKFAF